MRERSTSLWSFVLALLALGTVLSFTATRIDPVVNPPFQIHWIGLAVAFGLAERYSVHLELRREAHSLTFSEIPLTIGLIFVNPVGLIAARIVGGAIGHAIVRRPRLVKYVFNVSQFTIDVSVAVLIFHWVLGSESPVEPRGWIAAFAAIAGAHIIGWLCVSAVLRIAGAPITPRSALRVVAVSLAAALAECAVVLGGAGTLWRDGRSWVLIVFIGVGFGYFFLSFLRIRERHQSLATLHAFTTGLVADDLSSVTRTVLEGVAELLQAGRVVIVVPDGDDLERTDYDGSEVTRTRWTPGQANVDLLTAFVHGGHHPAPALGESTDPLHDLRGPESVSAVLPMLDRNGIIVAIGRMSDARDFDDEDVQLLETAAGQASSALHNAQLVERLRHEAGVRAHQALHDDVTDLPNQRGLIEQLADQLVEGVPLIILTVRVNTLREVNEMLGRAIGEEMLRQVAARLRPIGRQSWLARSGTDEFSLLARGGQAEADAIAQLIVDAFELPVLCDDVALAVTVGIGVALSPEHGTDAENLLRRASLAASRTVLEGTTVSTWAVDRDPYDPQRLMIAADLRDAIPAGELEVYFQPQLDIVNGLIISAEALVRWDHPRLGQLRPDQFIPAAENTGAIDALTLHVLTVAAMTGARWRELGWDLDIAVNLSARNLTNASFAADVAVVLDRTGLPAGSLTMELTESSVMTEAERALKTLHELDELGIAISIDDFGTGYSSLAHLRRLPVGEIKIDKSFVFDLTTSESDEAIVRSMIDLGHNLGLTVVVEGVETVEVRDRLHELGSDRLQGYLLSRPLPVDAFEHWVSERPLRTIAGTPQDRVVRLQQRR